MALLNEHTTEVEDNPHPPILAPLQRFYGTNEYSPQEGPN